MKRQTKCRWCLKPMEIDLPDDPAVRRTIISLSGRCGCNRCADYHRKREELSDLMQRVALWIDRNRKAETLSEKDLTAQTNRMRMLTVELVKNAEEFYLISGLAQDLDMFHDSVREMPDRVKWLCNEFEKGAHQLAIQTHGVS